MQRAAVFSGTALSSVEEKGGRVSIPAETRAIIELNGNGERAIMVGLHESGKCLAAYDAAWSNEWRERIDAAKAMPFSEAAIAAEKAMAQAFAGMDRIAYDPAGRFILPKDLRADAGIGRWAVFTGIGNTFLIWSPQQLLASTEPEYERARRRCRAMCEEKGIKL